MQQACSNGKTASRTVKVLVAGAAVAAAALTLCGIVCTATESALLLSENC